MKPALWILGIVVSLAYWLIKEVELDTLVAIGIALAVGVAAAAIVIVVSKWDVGGLWRRHV